MSIRIAVKLSGQAMFTEEVDDVYAGAKKHINNWLDDGVLHFRLNNRQIAVDFLCDDEGLLKKLPPNFPWDHGPPLGMQAICGPVVFTGPADDNGDTTSIQDTQIRVLELFFARIPEEWVALLQEHRPDAFEPKMFVETMSVDELLRRMGER